MENSVALVEKVLNIKAMVSRKTGLILAVCDELDGFSVFGNSLEDVERRLPSALKDHFDMLGIDVERVSLIDSEEDSVFRSFPVSICAQAFLSEQGPRDSR